MNHLHLRLLEWRRLAGRATLRGPGFRVAALLALCALALSLASYCAIRGVPDLGGGRWRLAARYALVYWLRHPVLLAVTIALPAFLGLGTWTEKLVRQWVPPFEIALGDFRRDRSLTSAARWLALTNIALLLATLPFLHSLVPAFTRRGFYLVYLLSSAITYYLTVPRSHRREVEHSLSRFTFPTPPAFNSASIGTGAMEAQYAKRLHYHGAMSERVTPLTGDDIRLGDSRGDSRWPGNDTFLQRLASFVEVPVTALTLHEKTTAAISAALDYLYAEEAVCLSTDLEYPSIRAAITARAGLLKAEVACAAEVWAGLLSGTDVAVRVAANAKRLAAHHKRVIVCLSHVVYECGLVIDLAALASELRTSRNVVIVIDGAQAVGNIHPEAEVLRYVSFYAFSGHKWLLGEPTLGALYANDRILEADSSDLSKTLVRARPFSYWRQEDAGDRETVNLDPYVTLNAMLGDLLPVGAAGVERHNTLLAKTFRQWMQRLALADIPRLPQRGGIVPVLVNDASAIARRLFQETGYALEAVRKNSALRVCFHYNISENDVHDLTYHLARILATAPSARTGERSAG